MAKLTAAFVGRVRAGKVEPGRYRDGSGLLLNVSAGGASWLMRYKVSGRRREMGLGALKAVSLSEARKLVAQHRLTVSGYRVDPLDQQREARIAAEQAAILDAEAARLGVPKGAAGDLSRCRALALALVRERSGAAGHGARRL
jgi:Arm DNA-binding domain